MITQKEVDEIASQILDKKMEDTVVLFHLLFCGREHDIRGCYFEQEEHIVNTWMAPIHIKWVEYTKKIMSELRLNTQSFKETLDMVRHKFGKLEEIKEEDCNQIKLIELYIQMRIPINKLPILTPSTAVLDVTKHIPPDEEEKDKLPF